MGQAKSARKSKTAANAAAAGPLDTVAPGPVDTVAPGPVDAVAQPICSLPVLGATTVEDAVFYSAVGVVSIVGWVSWPTAALIGAGHALHQRARNVVRAGAPGQVREALLEAFEDVG